MPLEYELLQISSAGLIRERTRLDKNNRWSVNIGTSDFPQRLNILFRNSLHLPIKQWNREQVVSVLQFPLLEGVVVQDTIWTVGFEGSSPPLNVSVVLDQSQDFPHRLGVHVPGLRSEAAHSLIGFNLIRQHNLLRVLNSLPVSVRQEEEMRHWYLHWLEEWNTVEDKVDFQFSHLPQTLQNVTSKLIARPVDSAMEAGETLGIVRPFLRTMSANSREALRDNKEQSVRGKFGTTADSVVKQSVPILSSQVYWQGRISDEMMYLLGTEEGMIKEIRLASVPKAGGWTIQFSEHIWLGISVSLLLPIVVLVSVRWIHLMELWLQFPHFWGMVAGVLLWTFLPESFIGVIVIILTLAAYFRPSWTRRRYNSKPF
jgi:hypothetical protein